MPQCLQSQQVRNSPDPPEDSENNKKMYCANSSVLLFLLPNFWCVYFCVAVTKEDEEAKNKNHSEMRSVLILESNQQAFHIPLYTPYPPPVISHLQT